MAVKRGAILEARPYHLQLDRTMLFEPPLYERCHRAKQDSDAIANYRIQHSACDREEPNVSDSRVVENLAAARQSLEQLDKRIVEDRNDKRLPLTGPV